MFLRSVEEQGAVRADGVLSVPATLSSRRVQLADWTSSPSASPVCTDAFPENLDSEVRNEEFRDRMCVMAAAVKVYGRSLQRGWVHSCYLHGYFICVIV